MRVAANKYPKQWVRGHYCFVHSSHKQLYFLKCKITASNVFSLAKVCPCYWHYALRQVKDYSDSSPYYWQMILLSAKLNEQN